MGEALARWQHVETALFALTHTLLGTNFEASSIVFFQIKSADTKLQLVDRLCSQFVSPVAYKDRWQPLRKEITDDLQFRNGLAHYEVNHVVDPQMAALTQVPMVVGPHHADLRAVREGKISVVFVEALQYRAEGFVERYRQIIRFGFECAPLWRQQSALLPPDLQITLEKARRKATAPTRAPPL